MIISWENSQWKNPKFLIFPFFSLFDKKLITRKLLFKFQQTWQAVTGTMVGFGVPTGMPSHRTLRIFGQKRAVFAFFLHFGWFFRFS